MKKTLTRFNFFKLFLLLTLVVLIGGISATTVFADRLSYDRYAAQFQKTPSDSSFWKKAALHFPTLPFLIVKEPTDRALVYIEKTHLDKKVKWIYDEMQERGLTPHLNVLNVSNLEVGGEFDFVRLAHRKHQFPDLTVHGGIRYAQGKFFDVTSEVGWERIAESGLSAFGNFQYEYRMLEHFYGIGPDTSRGEGHVYGTEMTKLEPILRYEWASSYHWDTAFTYRNININGGKDGGRGQVGDGPIFSRDRVSGLDGDSLISISSQLMRDTRNQKENSTQGGYQRFKIGYHEGLNSSRARYWKYEAELAQYVKLRSDRRVLAFHFYGEHNDELNNGVVPFHQLVKLGGYGSRPYLSHTLRSFDFNRFTDESALLFNLEYRYNIWHYRDFKLDTVFFFDEGQVFGEISEFQFKDFRESYGIGFRLNVANVPLLSFEMAHGDEGTNFYVKSQMPF